jgi:hypothetical protein
MPAGPAMVMTVLQTPDWYLRYGCQLWVEYSSILLRTQPTLSCGQRTWHSITATLGNHGSVQLRGSVCYAALISVAGGTPQHPPAEMLGSAMLVSDTLDSAFLCTCSFLSFPAVLLHVYKERHAGACLLSLNITSSTSFLHTLLHPLTSALLSRLRPSLLPSIVSPVSVLWTFGSHLRAPSEFNHPYIHSVCPKIGHRCRQGHSARAEAKPYSVCIENPALAAIQSSSVTAELLRNIIHLRRISCHHCAQLGPATTCLRHRQACTLSSVPLGQLSSDAALSKRHGF